MLINPSEPFITKILKIKETKSGKKFAIVKHKTDGPHYDVHIYNGQDLRVGDKIECIAERLDRNKELIHQTRYFLYNSLYKVSEEYIFRVICEKIDYSNFYDRYYLDVYDVKNKLFHRLYIDYNTYENDYLFLSLIKGCYVKCIVEGIKGDYLDLICKGISIFNFRRNISDPLYGEFYMMEYEVFDFIYNANKRLLVSDPMECEVLIDFNDGGHIYNLINYVSTEVNTEIKQQECSDIIDTFSAEELETKISSPNKKYIARKINFEEEREQNTQLGINGEEWVLEYEKRKLLSVGKKELSNKVEWVSKTRGDGLGYDIESYDSETEEKIFIEVKTTKGACDNAFYISKNELDRSKDTPNYYLYRLYNYDERNSEYKLMIIKGDLSYLCTEPVSYRVRLDF